MNPAQAAPAEPSQDAALVAALFAVDPAGLGGVALRAAAAPSLRHRLRRNPLDDAGSTVRVQRALTELMGSA